ncbi:MAG: phospholipase D-like domain-containing protein [Anaerolineales bacterium]|nr:phospholipase D-like domain-containing protein [Anaerolineales bacterium]
MDNWQTHLKNGGKSGLLYGLGLASGALIATLIFSIISLDFISAIVPGGGIVAGLLLAFVIVGISMGIGGFIGAYSLRTVHQEHGRFGYGWRGSWSFGIPFALLVFLGIVAISLLNFYNVEETPTQAYMTIFAIVGLLFGVVYGILFGLATARVQGFWRVFFASALGFAIGGAGLGFGVWNAVYRFTAGESLLTETLFLLLGLFLFGGIGGLLMGYLYSHMADEEQRDRKALSPLGVAVRAGAVVLVLAVIVSACRPLREEIRNFMTPQQSFLSSVFEPITIGTHWMEPVFFTEGAIQNPALSASGSSLAMAWSDGQDIFFQSGRWEAGSASSGWGSAINVTNSEAAAIQPGITVDNAGTAHLVWSNDASEVQYTRCEGDRCSGAVPVSAGACDTGLGANPAIALNDQGGIMAVWEAGTNNLAYATWDAGERPGSGSRGCIFDVPQEGGNLGNPRVAADLDDVFWVVFGPEGGESGGIGAASFADGSWDTDIPAIGLGRWPELYFDLEGGSHVAYCSADQVQYFNFTSREGGSVASEPCSSRPEIGVDSEGSLNIVWFSESVESVTGIVNDSRVLYESHQSEGAWTAPAIVSQTGALTQPAMDDADDGSLHMAWGVDSAKGAGGLYASFVPYSCDVAELSDLERIIYDIAVDEKYRTPDNPVPFCLNRYEQLVHSPNPDPAFSDNPPTENGPFDVVADLVTSAQYEVLFMTMWYDKDDTGEGLSPGATLGRAIKQLYDQLVEDPSRYPRGMTVRILLDNPPEIATLSFGNQLWNPLEDLHNAGLREMVNEELGWKVEVANFRGAWPHGHTKGVVVDGATLIGAGFNYQHAHFETDHPSGKGSGRWDLGTKITGPIAQDAVRVFDDMWAGAILRECANFGAETESAWKSSCRDSLAVVTHVPEVLKYYIPGDDTVAFSMFRSEKRDEADNQHTAVMSAAEESLEIVQVNFAMNVNCNLNYLYDICTYEQASEWGKAIVEAAENGAQVRVLVKLAPAEGVENTVTVQILTEELERRGIADRVEFRSFGTDAVHYKGVLVDNELLMVGSQNFHYSAFNQNGGLTEYTVATNDPDAVREFKDMFEFHWEQAVPLGK